MCYKIDLICYKINLICYKINLICYKINLICNKIYLIQDVSVAQFKPYAWKLLLESRTARWTVTTHESINNSTWWLVYLHMQSG